MDIQTIIDKAEGQTALANTINQLKGSNLKQGHISYWIKTGKVPGDHVLAVSEALGWEITPHQIRPDLYPDPQDGLPEHLRVRGSAVA